MEKVTGDKLVAQDSEHISSERLLTMLSSALGSHAGELLRDPDVIEIMLNPDGKLWVDKLGSGREFTGQTVRPIDAERVIFIVASSIKTICNQENPLLNAELPGIKARFQGILPPVVENPAFTIRKKALRIFSLADYVAAGSMTASQCQRLKDSLLARKNVLIAGGTGSGKTTLANALLAEIAATNDRLVIIEDTRELQCAADDAIFLRTKDDLVDMTKLLRTSMRLRPDRIIIGEVRGAEALTLLKAWNTGHPGGCATVHADSARKALSRLEQLVYEAGIVQSKQLIGETVNVVAFIERTNIGRKIKEIAEVTFTENGGYSLQSLD